MPWPTVLNVLEAPFGFVNNVPLGTKSSPRPDDCACTAATISSTIRLRSDAVVNRVGWGRRISVVLLLKFLAVCQVTPRDLASAPCLFRKTQTDIAPSTGKARE